jgi:Superinfection immunity protein
MGGLSIFHIIWLFILLAAYLIPTIIARKRNCENKGAITALNIFLGLSVVGWVAAFIWACVSPLRLNNSGAGDTS